jgi:hypothetical protein
LFSITRKEVHSITACFSTSVLCRLQKKASGKKASKKKASKKARTPIAPRSIDQCRAELLIAL